MVKEARLMSEAPAPQFHYGAVYFRKSSPPRRDWERDYAQAAADGYTVFRHWFIWGAIETAPGVYDWDDYDRQLALGEEYGIKTVISEITNSVPQWLLAERPDLLPLQADGNPAQPEMGVSCGTGGFFTGLCLDKPDARQYVSGFLRALAIRYKGHPALLGYDVANECYKPSSICYCENTLQAYRKWLQDKYGDIKTLNEAWKTYSYTAFDQIAPPPSPAFFPNSVDWLDFRRTQHLAHISWKADILRAADPTACITAHGMAETFASHSALCCDDWGAAALVETYGATWVQSRKGNQPWKQLSALDLTSAASRGKPFWHSEAQGGPLWLQPGLEGRSRRDGRVTAMDDLRIWNLMTMACGASGIMYTRFRPLLDGPLFGAFAPYGDDGLPTPRSVMAARIAHWVNDPRQAALMRAKPVPGDIRILFVPECETASYLLTFYGNRHLYPKAVLGAWRGFHEAGIQADFAHINDIHSMDRDAALYLPMPVSLSPAHANALLCWVREGGTLICEGAPGYFSHTLHEDVDGAKTLLLELFGVCQLEAEFAPDLAVQTNVEILGHTLPCGGYLQTFTTAGATTEGTLNGEILAASFRCGKGRTMLLGTSPGIGYMEGEDSQDASVFSALLAFANQTPRLRVSNPKAVARLHQNEDRFYVWLLNPQPVPVAVTLTPDISAVPGEVLWAGGCFTRQDGTAITATLGAHDGMVFRLIPNKG